MNCIMTRKAIALLILAGASYAFPYETESKLSPPVEGPSIPEDVPLTDRNGFTSEDVPFTPENVHLTPENVPLTPENLPLTPENVPLTPGNVPLNSENGPVTADGPLPEISEDLTSKDGPKPEGTDLKTDATFWWPFYYRSYYRYPSYRYYRPRVYYRYYYW